MSTSRSVDDRADPLRFLFAAGGTGGHLMPALATAEALERDRECEFLFVGSPRASEREIRGLIPYPIAEVSARPLAGAGPIAKLRTLVGLVGSVAEARRHLHRFRPHLAIATGGYVCGPTGVAARLRGTPLLVLEQNAVPGLTTRWLRPFAGAVAISFAETAERIGPKAVLTGNPIRSTLPAAPRRDGSPLVRRARSGLRLLILGGSQGASGLNTMVESALPILARAEVGIRITHQTGKREVTKLREAYAAHGIPATVTPFITEIGEAYAEADLVCARAGATTLAELAYCGLPSILVPYPHAAGDHQRANAEAMVRAGAAELIPERANGRPLAEAIRSLAADPERMAAMAGAAATHGRDDAAGAVAELALDMLEPEPDQQLHTREIA